ncbi:YaiI/YqxD family protein [Paenibacillus sp. N1-5-1-14]|uniref:YaiI/YqxD family protein n=1 Tax=Paenibacillus radicibacter TaxID=2972488 RepID=UPI002159058A|nr:YaiI/YqxD family protein [Paenibacillus radicibacter]MCR8641966.1 YaiI/YqxD family protein [Paenibacillus radicibacter]
MPTAHRVIVDADSCPVKHEIIAAGQANSVPVVLVASFDHVLKEAGDHVSIVQVDRSDQSADLYIANHIKRGDILVSGDFGLAAMALGKGAYAMSVRGQQYTNENIDYLLDRRHAQMKMRRSGKHSKGPKPFTDEDRKNFLQSLTRLLQILQENSKPSANSNTCI